MDGPEPVVSQRDRAGRRLYTDREQAEALAVLASHKGNIGRAHRETGIPRETLRDWWNRSRRVPRDTVELHRAKVDLADDWEDVACESTRITLAKLPRASAAQAAVVGGIATEKMLLLRGEATVIHSTADAERAALFARHFASAFQGEPTTTAAPAEPTPPAQLPPAQGDQPV